MNKIMKPSAKKTVRKPSKVKFTSPSNELKSNDTIESVDVNESLIESEEIKGEKAQDKQEWIKSLRLIKSKKSKGNRGQEGVVTVVKDKNSKRVKLKGVITEELDNPEFIKFYVTENEFVVQAATEEEDDAYLLRLEGKKRCLIYNSELIDHLMEIFQLDFTDSTSQMFGSIKMECIDNIQYAVIYKES